MIAICNDVGMAVMVMEYKALSVPDITKRAKAAFQRFDIQKAAVFGSSARGGMHHGSDIDILTYTNGHAFEDIVIDSMMRKAVCMTLINFLTTLLP